MKIWAVVIGQKGKHTRYVAYAPSGGSQNGLLAVYGNKTRAQAAANKFKADGVKFVSVVVFSNNK